MSSMDMRTEEDDSMMMHYYQVELPALQKEQEELRALWNKMIDDPEFVDEYSKIIDSDNAEVSGPRPLAAEGSRSNDVLGARPQERTNDA